MVVRQGTKINVDCNDCYSSVTVRPLCKYVKDESVSKLVLYEHASQQGRSKTYHVETPYFGGFNDVFTSVVVAEGDWELYEHANFQGRRTTLKQGVQRNLNKNYIYSSSRPICSSYRKRNKCSIKRIQVVDDGKVKPHLGGTKVIASNSDGPGCHLLNTLKV